MTVLSPAKINLSLRVLGKRPDGYHEIETLMVPLSLADEVTVTVDAGSGVRVTCDDPRVPAGDDNLASRAARAFADSLGRQLSADIHIAKRIPMGAGLAGGSSNAAAVIRALDRVMDAGLRADEMERIAAQVGSDTAFFIRCLPALCRGRGELIEPIAMDRAYPVVIVKPPFGIETPWAYQALASAAAIDPNVDPPQSLDGLEIFNDLERPVFEKFLLLPVIKAWLRCQPEVRVAAMSGSGSTVFAVLAERDSGPALLARFTHQFGPHFWTVCAETQM